MSTPPSTTVLKAFELLALFAERPLLGAGEAARLLGAPRASTHRLLVTLRAAGVLESNDSGQYRLGLRLFELGATAPLRRRLHESCLPTLERLSAEVGLPAYLAVRDGNDLVCLEKVQHRQVDVPIQVGQRRPLHSSAAGKVLLAHAPKTVVERYVTQEVDRPTPHTIVEPRRLLEELEQTRARGLAREREESWLGLASVAAGLRRHTGKVVAAIALTAPTLRDARRLRAVEGPLRTAAAAIDRQLGWCPPNPLSDAREMIPA
jgi:DNA-binding IclR family transcriptional regulator